MNHGRKTGLGLFMDKIVGVEKFEEDEAIFTIDSTKECCDKNGIFDEGLLLAIIDEYSGMAGILFSKKYKMHFSNSLSIKKVSFKNLTMNKKYLMTVRLKEQVDKMLLIEMDITEEGSKEIIKFATHYKKVTNHKF